MKSPSKTPSKTTTTSITTTPTTTTPQKVIAPKVKAVLPKPKINVNLKSIKKETLKNIIAHLPVEVQKKKLEIKDKLVSEKDTIRNVLLPPLTLLLEFLKVHNKQGNTIFLKSEKDNTTYKFFYKTSKK